MAYDSWENVGYKVIDKLNSFDVLLKEMRADIKEINTAQKSLQMKMWVIASGATIGIAIAQKMLGM